jgi:hypothetical protein
MASFGCSILVSVDLDGRTVKRLERKVRKIFDLPADAEVPPVDVIYLACDEGLTGFDRNDVGHVSRFD